MLWVCSTVSEVPGTSKKLESPKTLTPSLNALEDFDVLRPHLQHFLNEPLLTAFDRMIDCDVLVASRSSLSACAAYLKSERGIAIYHPSTQNMLQAVDGHYSCDDATLDKKLGAFVDSFRDGEAGARRPE